MSRDEVLTAAELRRLLGQAAQRAKGSERTHEERDVQRAIVDALEGPEWSHRVFVFHVPNGGARHVIEAVNLMRDGVRPGVADLPVMLPGGRICWLEVKSESGHLRQSQREFRDVCHALGHGYYVVRSVAEALAAVEREIGATNHERRTA